MANELGNNGVVTIGGNVVAELVDMNWDSAVEIVPNGALTVTDETHLSGSATHNGSINCMYDVTDATGQEAMTVGASLTLLWLPQGNTSGDASYTCTATVSTVGIAVAKNTVTTRAFGIAINGGITQGTVV